MIWDAKCDWSKTNDTAILYAKKKLTEINITVDNNNYDDNNYDDNNYDDHDYIFIEKSIYKRFCHAVVCHRRFITS